MGFKKGNKFGKGGPRPNSGRPLSWLKELAAQQIKKHKLIQYVGEVGSGKDVEEKISVNPFTGEVMSRTKVQAKTQDRLKAVEFLAKTAEDKLGDAAGQTVNPVVILLPQQNKGEVGKVE